MQGKEVVTKEEYTEKLQAALDARSNKNFIIVARTDARATEGLDMLLKEDYITKKLVQMLSLLKHQKLFKR